MSEFLDAIILSSREYREYDALLSVLTREYGVMQVVARGICKIKSKNASACQPFTYARVQLLIQERRELQGLRSAQIIESYRYIREDLLKQSIASFFCECIEKSRFEQDVFSVLKGSLDALQETKRPFTVLCLFQSIMNRLHGIEPYVDGCVRCRQTRCIHAISVRDGGFVCRFCHQHFDKAQSKERLKCFRLFCKAKWEHYELLAEVSADFQDFENLYSFFEEHAGIPINSIRFLRKLAAL